MGKAEEVFREVLEKITPTKKEKDETQKVLDAIMGATEKVIRPLKLKKTLAGSFLRDTWLADKQEFDIFILFPPSVPREDLEKTGLDVGKKIVAALKGTYEMAYAEHPYVRAKFGKSAVDLVPCYDIDDPGKIKSAVDRTPHHNRYILKMLKPGMSPEVRLLKQFCKGIGVYGSDLKVEGFSGYLAELLIIHYGSLKNLMMEAVKWEAGKVVIDLEGHHLSKKTDMKEKFPMQPLVVIDPVDRNRNVAAALSLGNFELFKHSCISFLDAPGEKFFRLQKAPLGEGQLAQILGKRGTKIITVSFPRPAVVDDILFPQLRRSSKRVTGMLQDADFRVIGHDVWCSGQGCWLLFELEVWKLPKIRKITGPPAFSGFHSKQFINKYAGKNRVWIEGSNWVTEAEREFTGAASFIEDALKPAAKSLEKAGIASHVAGGLSKGFSVEEDRNAMKGASKDPGFALFLANYFKRKII